jgi:hypothetical protein
MAATLNCRLQQQGQRILSNKKTPDVFVSLKEEEDPVYKERTHLIRDIETDCD